jgi:cytochrome bd-type quinol oxidase subunit 2
MRANGQPHQGDIQVSNTPQPSRFVSIYPLLLAAMIGGTLVDQMYSWAIRQTLAPGTYGAAASKVSDALLMLALLVLIAGFVSVLPSAGRARLLFAESLAVFSLEFVVPVIAATVHGSAAYASSVGPLLRTLLLTSALLLAFVATHPVVLPTSRHS